MTFAIRGGVLGRLARNLSLSRIVTRDYFAYYAVPHRWGPRDLLLNSQLKEISAVAASLFALSPLALLFTILKSGNAGIVGFKSTSCALVLCCTFGGKGWVNTENPKTALLLAWWVLLLDFVTKNACRKFLKFQRNLFSFSSLIKVWACIRCADSCLAGSVWFNWIQKRSKGRYWSRWSLATTVSRMKSRFVRAYSLWLHYLTSYSFNWVDFSQSTVSFADQTTKLVLEFQRSQKEKSSLGLRLKLISAKLLRYTL